MPWSDFPLTSLTLPGDAGPNDPRIVIGDDIPPEIAVFSYGGVVRTTVAAIVYWIDANRFFFEAIATGGTDTALYNGLVDRTAPGQETLVYQARVSDQTGGGDTAIEISFGGGLVGVLPEQIVYRFAICEVSFGRLVEFDGPVEFDARVAGDGFRPLDKPGTTTRTNTAAITLDPHLQTNVAANATYQWQASIPWNADAAADLQIGVSVPAGATCDRWRAATNGTSGVWTACIPNAATTLFQAGTGTDQTLLMSGRLVTVGAGTFGIRWGPNANVAQPCSLLGDATMLVHRTA